MAAYRGIRYARAERFGTPVMEDLGDTIPAGEMLVCPQRESKLGGIWGPENTANPLSEDCLRLSIFTPGTTEPAPVIVWICGGSFVTGSGLFARYDGTMLSRECGAVVVCISYRVGALGFLPGEGMSPGLQDQICALGWVRKYISRFGGDPARITVCGQSAGAFSIACHIAGLREPLFQKAILLSAPLGIRMSKRDGRKVRRIFESKLGTSLTDATIEDMLSAQEATIKAWRGFVPFAPAGADPFPHGNVAPGLESVMICCQYDDASPYVQKLPCFLRGLAEGIVTGKVFHRPMMRYAEVLRSRGIEVRERIFDWTPDNGGLGACHTLELPLLFGGWECWCIADMLRGVSEDEFENRGKLFRSEIAAYINDQKL